MIGITISGKAYAAVAAMLPAGFAVEQEVAADGEYRVECGCHVSQSKLSSLGVSQARPLAPSFCDWSSAALTPPSFSKGRA
jgi:hypothetical protein